MRNRQYAITIALIAFMSVAFLYFDMWSIARAAFGAYSCTNNAQDKGIQVDCFDQLLTAEVQRHGLRSTRSMFSYLYETQPVFAATCHRRGHTLGDAVYYNISSTNGNFEKVDFTQDLTSCQYGFFHGYFEHLFQNNPTPEFIVETCGRLTLRLQDIMNRIEQACFEGAGHGLFFSHIEHIPKNGRGHFSAFVDNPLTTCETLKASTSRIVLCKKGVFNSFFQLISSPNEYGFPLNVNDGQYLFLCDDLLYSRREACYFSATVTMHGLTNVQSVLALIKNMTEPVLLGAIMKGGMMTITHSTIAQSPRYSIPSSLLSQCYQLSGDLLEYCADGIFRGLQLNLMVPDANREEASFCKVLLTRGVDLRHCQAREKRN